MEASNKMNSSLPMASLKAARSVTFTARTWMSMTDDDGLPQANLIPGQAFAVKARRPGSLRIEEDPSDSVIQEAIGRAGCFAGNPFNTFISDGTRQTELCSTSHVYFEDKAAPTLARIRSKRGLPRMLRVDTLLAKNPLRNFSPIVEEAVEGTPVTVYVREEYLEDEQRQQRLYVTRETGLPLRLSTFQTGTSEEGVEVQRIDFADWVLDAALLDSTFDTTPPPDAKPAPPPSPWFDPNVKARMKPSPLDAIDLAGNAVSLADYQGKVVLLDYWAIWCQPCLIEMQQIKALYELYHPHGLEILGISLDHDDEEKRVREYLKEKAIPWRQIFDTKGFQSPLATVYKVGAIPFTLLIGRNGRIAAVNAHGDDLAMSVYHALTKQPSRQKEDKE